jgi:hypothetical protein
MPSPPAQSFRKESAQIFRNQHKFSICADQMHVLEYLGDAAKALWPQADQEAEREKWFGVQRGHLRAGRWRTVCDALGDGEQEAVVDARRYLENHHQDMNYGQLHASGWPVASGEAEGVITYAGCQRPPPRVGECSFARVRWPRA